MVFKQFPKYLFGLKVKVRDAIKKQQLADLRTLSQLSLPLPPLAQLGQILIGTFYKMVPPPPPSLQLGQYAFEILVDPPPTQHKKTVSLDGSQGEAPTATN